MAIRKTLTSIVLAGALTLGTTGCDKDHSQYKYTGKIGEDQITFTESYLFFPYDNILTVRKLDGRVIKYVDDLRNDLKIEYVEITKDGQKTKYTADDAVGRPIMEEAQKQFDIYLRKIKETRIKQGLESLK